MGMWRNLVPGRLACWRCVYLSGVSSLVNFCKLIWQMSVLVYGVRVILACRPGILYLRFSFRQVERRIRYGILDTSVRLSRVAGVFRSD